MRPQRSNRLRLQACIVRVLCQGLGCASNRLLWGMAGQSNALAVADGLGFSRDVLREARAVAADMRAVTDSRPRNETLAVSLEEQLRDSQARLPACTPYLLGCKDFVRAKLICNSVLTEVSELRLTFRICLFQGHETHLSQVRHVIPLPWAFSNAVWSFSRQLSAVKL